MVLLGGLGIPFERRAAIGFYADPLLVTHGKVKLRVRVALHGRLPEPGRRLVIILFDADAFEKADAEAVLRMGVFFFRGGKPELNGLRFVALFVTLCGAVAQRVGAFPRQTVGRRFARFLPLFLRTVIKFYDPVAVFKLFHCFL